MGRSKTAPLKAYFNTRPWKEHSDHSIINLIRQLGDHITRGCTNLLLELSSLFLLGTKTLAVALQQAEFAFAGPEYHRPWG